MDYEELWVEIEDFPHYLVSNTGLVYSIRSDKILRPGVTPTGYLHVKLGVGNQRAVHRLVVEAFIGHIPTSHEVNHKDGDKSNNNDWNLEIVTRSENMVHAFKNGLRLSTPRFMPRSVRILETQEDFESIGAVARNLGVSQPAVSQALRRGSRVKGYSLEYIE